MKKSTILAVLLLGGAGFSVGNGTAGDLTNEVYLAMSYSMNRSYSVPSSVYDGAELQELRSKYNLTKALSEGSDLSHEEELTIATLERDIKQKEIESLELFRKELLADYEAASWESTRKEITRLVRYASKEIASKSKSLQKADELLAKFH